jgi:hypothetical protein
MRDQRASSPTEPTRHSGSFSGDAAYRSVRCVLGCIDFDRFGIQGLG